MHQDFSYVDAKTLHGQNQTGSKAVEVWTIAYRHILRKLLITLIYPTFTEQMMDKRILFTGNGGVGSKNMLELTHNHQPNQFYDVVNDDGSMKFVIKVTANMFEYNMIEMEVPKPENPDQTTRVVQTTSDLRDLQRLITGQTQDSWGIQFKSQNSAYDPNEISPTQPMEVNDPDKNMVIADIGG